MTLHDVRLQPGRRHSAWPGGRPRPGFALDLGSARTRAWAPGRGVIFDVPTVTFPGAGAIHPIQRGTVVDPEGTSRMIDRLLGRHLPRFRRPVIVLTTPVLGGPNHRSALRTAMEVLRPRGVLTVPGPKAVAIAARGDTTGPLLVVDIGAHLTEVALLIDGAVADAYHTALGTIDLDGSTTERDLGRSVASMVTDMLRRDRTGQTLNALQQGVLLAGGGALRPACVYDIASRLDTDVRPVAAPHTAALRGAARLLQSATGRRGATVP
ncbi:rod shape-determining protein [Streptomyces cavernicola]|uniref:Rod shape-determining protein n=1 Tax=Streptomyces cavernicola TaxID=3043613 RepID=A0ABT6SMR4_9ACTN|nr:rod shape-determining protein [Streptomyces sp. B-S-A6]MDI3408967.1 rod shape-determining protein [Streptomyces sp. B-S-A6]